MSFKPVLRYLIVGASKNVKFRLSWNSTKFEVLARFHDDSNGEVRFVIRDLEKFQILIEITILPFFRKLEFSRVLQIQTWVLALYIML